MIEPENTGFRICAPRAVTPPSARIDQTSTGSPSAGAHPPHNVAQTHANTSPGTNSRARGLITAVPFHAALIASFALRRRWRRSPAFFQNPTTRGHQQKNG